MHAINTPPKSSYDWLDWVRAIGIYLVVLGHTQIDDSVKIWIYAFHMPLFFAVSGFLFNPSKYSSAANFIRTKAKQLLVPYLVFNVVTFLVWLGKLYFEPIPDINLGYCLVEMLWGGELLHNTPLWFLLALFVVEMTCYFLSKYIAPYLIILLFCTLGLATVYVSLLPFYIDAAILALPFYGLFHWQKKNILSFLERGRIDILVALCLLIPLVVLLSYLNGRVNLLSSDCGAHYVLFYTTALLGTMQLFLLGRLLQDLVNKIGFIRYISRNTIVILSLHISVLMILNAVIMVTGYSRQTIFAYDWVNVVLSFVVIAVLVPVINIINRYATWSIGRNKKQTT